MNSNNSSTNLTLFGCVAIIIVIFIVFLKGDSLLISSAEVDLTSTRNCEPVSPLPVSGTATSGKMFKGDIITTFDGSKVRFAPGARTFSASLPQFQKDELICDFWSVVTTIFEPSEAVIRQSKLSNWCLVVVGDKKGPFTYDLPSDHYVFLTAEKQEKISQHFQFVKNLPWNHFGRKNIGYLYAILHGAKAIWDFDDDNILLSDTFDLPIPGYPNPSISRKSTSITTPLIPSKTISETQFQFQTPPTLFTSNQQHPFNLSDQSIPLMPSSSYLVVDLDPSSITQQPIISPLSSSSSDPKSNISTTSSSSSSSSFPLTFNPYPLMGSPTKPCWPRGYPLAHIKERNHFDLSKLQTVEKGWTQYLQAYLTTEQQQQQQQNGKINSKIATSHKRERLLITQHEFSPSLSFSSLSSSSSSSTSSPSSSSSLANLDVDVDSDRYSLWKERQGNNINLDRFLSLQKERQNNKDGSISSLFSRVITTPPPPPTTSTTTTTTSSSSKDRVYYPLTLTQLPPALPPSTIYPHPPPPPPPSSSSLNSPLPLLAGQGSVGIIQSLANNDPDVDALYRLTQPLPFSFHTCPPSSSPSSSSSSSSSTSSSSISTTSPTSSSSSSSSSSSGLEVGCRLLAVPIKSYSPYNAQATLHLYPALWSLLLPVSVHGRVSDIWRGLAYQKIAKYLNQRLVFSPPLVTQERNAHHYLADFDSELPLYLQSQRLIEQLSEWDLISGVQIRTKQQQQHKQQFARKLQDISLEINEQEDQDQDDGRNNKLKSPSNLRSSSATSSSSSDLMDDSQLLLNHGSISSLHLNHHERINESHLNLIHQNQQILINSHHREMIGNEKEDQKGDHALLLTVEALIEELWIRLYEHGYIGLSDVYLQQDWLSALQLAGYQFPILPSPIP